MTARYAMQDLDRNPPGAEPFVAAMRAEGLPELAVRVFVHHYRHLAAGATGFLGRDQIEPVETLPEATACAPHRALGEGALGRTVTIRLNGGLGTSMGLECAKSLLVVREGASFLDLLARQTLALRERTGAAAPLVLMNSFRTEADSLAALERYPGLARPGLGLGFCQHRIPKVLEAGLGRARCPGHPELEWCPPGHGDLFPALVTSGMLGRLLEHGFEYALIANADNLGAVLEPELLGFMVAERLEMLMEVADRTPADRKGGHLCRLDDGSLALRESAQCPPEERAEFQDVARYRFFNTNTVWLHLPALARLLERHHGVLPLPTIVNRKRLDPRDPASPPVLQLESALGAAISLFRRAAAIRVPRRRFSPVKTTDDLLAVRSDAFELTSDGRVALAPGREAPPAVALDRRHYARIDDFEQRFPHGPPSLVSCRSLVVEGDVRFGAGVVVEGEARVVASDGPATIPDGARVSGEVVLRSR